MAGDAFSEALALIPLIHLQVAANQRVLLMGADAAPAALAVLRYPQTVEVVIVDDSARSPAQLGDKRVKYAPNLAAIPAAWKADLLIVATPGISPVKVQALRAHHRADTGVAVFAVARASQVRATKDTLRLSWSVVQPYREFTPDVEDPTARVAWFLMAADHGFKRHRAVPPWSKRMTDKYVPAVFTLAKDEYALAYGGGA